MQSSADQNPPLNWKPCSPELLQSGVNCTTAPRWSAGPIGQHYHPPVGVPALIAYQVGDYDIVAHYSPAEAAAFLCAFSGLPEGEFTADDVVLVDDSFLDAPMQEEDGTPAPSLRVDLHATTMPTYLHGWE